MTLLAQLVYCSVTLIFAASSCDAESAYLRQTLVSVSVLGTLN